MCQISEIISKLFSFEIENYIFVYTPPKVGSTTLVTSLRVSLSKTYGTIHIHDETMLSVLTGINGIKINDIIKYLSSNGKNVYVIDVYRTPIERKMSEFFEKISPYHFNNTEQNISNYSIQRIANRFNNLFPHLENGDHYFDKYEIDISTIHPFDFNKKYTLQMINNIKYIKLRLCDSELWATILSNIFQTDIVLIPDYATQDKATGELYKRFKKEYKIPINFIKIIENDKFLNFYYNELERNNYINSWKERETGIFRPYTEEEFKFYMNLCLENQYINDVQVEHYIDNGCFCSSCKEKRRDIFFKAKSGEKITEKITHTYQVNNHKNKKNVQVVNSNKNDKLILSRKFKPDQFKIKSFNN